MNRSGARHRGPGFDVIALGAMAALIVAAVVLNGLTAYSSGKKYYPNCVDSRTGKVVNQKECGNRPDDYIWMTLNAYNEGYEVPGSARGGDDWFRADDTGARTNAGLPASGPIPQGTKVSSDDEYDDPYLYGGGDDCDDDCDDGG